MPQGSHVEIMLIWIMLIVISTLGAMRWEASLCQRLDSPSVSGKSFSFLFLPDKEEKKLQGSAHCSILFSELLYCVLTL